MHNGAPEISVIVLSYNTKDVTFKCLERLKESADYLGKPVEIIVVENGTDGTVDAIKKEFPWIKILEPGENLGFAKGNNLGIKESDKNSKYYLFLNSDALVKGDTLKKVCEFMENHNNCDVLGCGLRLENGKFQPSGGFLPTPFSTSTWILGIDLLPLIGHFFKPFHQKNIKFFKSDREIGWVMGAFLFMKREVVEETKGFDENFFMYMEEVEWERRIQDAGFTIWYTPSFEITHLDKTSSKSDPEKFRKIFQKEILGVVYYLKKYYPDQIFWVLPLIKLGLLMRWMAFFVLGNKIRQLAYLETLKTI
jgi:GT2 family glycosyltransferase